MRRLFYLLAFSMVIVTAAAGGKNEGGALVVHTDDMHEWYRSTCDDFENWVPQDCGQLNTRTDRDAVTPALIWFIAAFDPACKPGVTSI